VNMVQSTTGCSTSAAVWLNPAKCFPKANMQTRKVVQMKFIYVVSYDWASHSHHLFGTLQSTVVWLCGC